MADNHSKEIRSMNISHIRSKSSKPEEKVRKYLFSKGFITEKALKTFRESRILFCRNIRRWSLSMAAFGTNMIVPASYDSHPTWSTGFPKFRGTSSGTLPPRRLEKTRATGVDHLGMSVECRGRGKDYA